MSSSDQALLAAPAPGLGARAARLLYWETVIVLGVSLGRSAVYSVLSIAEKLTRPQAPLNQQVTQMNRSVTPDRPWLDLSYQLAGLILPLVPVALALYLLAVFVRPSGGGFAAMGFDLRRPGFDWVWGGAILVGIGVPGIGLYLGARALGINTIVQPANLAENWWTIPVLVGAAGMNAVLEEVLMLGYLFTRWSQAGARMWAIILVSALVRGSYHLYQGFGGFIGNTIMGVIFGLLYLRFKRVGPLVVAHFLLDLFAFVGYSLIAPHVSWL